MRSVYALTGLVSCVAASKIPITSVFGHKIPDTDAICSAIVYAWELEARGVPARAYRQGELNRETAYVLDRLGVEAPEVLGSLDSGAPVAIVDTNNPDELPDELDRCSIHSIVDHHKLCGLKTPIPVEIDSRPLCSTASILYARAKAANRPVPKRMAGLMLACILSDSLEFRSPTTTPADIEFAQELAAIAEIDLHEFAREMLNAKAEIGHLSPSQVVMMDSKRYEIGGRKLRISVLETTRPKCALDQQKDLQVAMKQIASEEELDEVILFVVDVLQQQATFIANDSDGVAVLVREAWGVPLSKEGTALLPNVLSRKKQIVPMLEDAARKVLDRATTLGEASAGQYAAAGPTPVAA